MVIDKTTRGKDLEDKLAEFMTLLRSGKSVAFVVRKGALFYDEKVKYNNENTMRREDVIRRITNIAEGDVIVSTTGKTSRELFEIREQKGQSHKYDFLTVGSMGHSSSIALGIALNKPNTRVWCIDGDGAVLMHMGSMAVIADKSPKNYIHVVINNCAHESVGGMPTSAHSINLVQIALGCGYKAAYQAVNTDELDKVLRDVKNTDGPIFIEIKCAIGSRDNLGRPTTTPAQNKAVFMDYLRTCE